MAQDSNDSSSDSATEDEIEELNKRQGEAGEESTELGGSVEELVEGL